MLLFALSLHRLAVTHGDDRRLAIIVGRDVSAGRCSRPQPPPGPPPRNGPGRRLPFAVTTAGPVISASFRPFRFGGGL